MEFWFYWLILIFILVIIEVSTINLVSIWFIASGIVSLFCSFFIESFLIQFAIFVILGIILLITTRKFLNRLLKQHNEKTNLDRVIGMIGVVTEEIDKNKVGEVKVDGKIWSAVSDSKIEKNKNVIIDALNGVKLSVRKKDDV